MKDFELFENENLGKVYTIQEIAEKLGYSRPNIQKIITKKNIDSKIIKNKRYITLKGLGQIKEYFDKQSVKSVQSVQSVQNIKNTSKLTATLVKELKTIMSKEELKNVIFYIIGFIPKQPEPLIQNNNIKSIPYDDRSTITPAQQKQIKDLIDKKIYKTNCNHKYNYYYKAIHDKYNITKYDQLLQKDFNNAIRYIENMR